MEHKASHLKDEEEQAHQHIAHYVRPKTTRLIATTTYYSIATPTTENAGIATVAIHISHVLVVFVPEDWRLQAA